MLEVRSAYLSCPTDSPAPPLNYDDGLLLGFSQAFTQGRLVSDRRQLASPYWLKHNTPYNPVEVFLTAVQFLDDHRAPLPQTTLPPEKDVRHFCHFVLSSGPVGLVQQFNKLLEITKGNAVGAANLGMISSRIYARSGDTRAYPGIQVKAEDVIKWNKSIANFEVYGQGAKSDALGDNYYFWTHFFAASAYRAINTNQAKIFSQLFNHGTEIMTLVRKHIAGQKTITDHNEASILGRNLGLFIAHSILEL